MTKSLMTDASDLVSCTKANCRKLGASIAHAAFAHHSSRLNARSVPGKSTGTQLPGILPQARHGAATRRQHEHRAATTISDTVRRRGAGDGPAWLATCSTSWCCRARGAWLCAPPVAGVMRRQMTTSSWSKQACRPVVVSKTRSSMRLRRAAMQSHLVTIWSWQDQQAPHGHKPCWLCLNSERRASLTSHR